MVTATLFGCNKVSICPGHTLFGQGYDNGMEVLADSVGELLKFAEEKKVLLFMEPAHRFETDLIVTVEDGIRFIKTYGFDELGIVLDTGHCFVNKESLPDCIKMLKGTPYHIHIDDNGGQSDDHKVPGEGGICFEPFLQALVEDGYKGYLTAELGWGYTTDPDAAVFKCKKVFDVLKQKIKA